MRKVKRLSRAASKRAWKPALLPLIDTKIQYPQAAVGDWQNKGMDVDQMMWVWPWFDAAMTAKARGK
jgi:hypothetical protein